MQKIGFREKRESVNESDSSERVRFDFKASGLSGQARAGPGLSRSNPIESDCLQKCFGFLIFVTSSPHRLSTPERIMLNQSLFAALRQETLESGMGKNMKNAFSGSSNRAFFENWLVERAWDANLAHPQWSATKRVQGMCRICLRVAAMGEDSSGKRRLKYEKCV